MGKSCCAAGCTNRYSKGSGVHFYRFPQDSERRTLWVAALGRKDWVPSEYSWLCSSHFASGTKSNNPRSPDYVPSIFACSVKRKRIKCEFLPDTKKKSGDDQLSAARSLLELSDGTRFGDTHVGRCTMTHMSMASIDRLAIEQQQLRNENSRLRKDCRVLMETNERLKKENDVLKQKMVQATEVQACKSECASISDLCPA